MDSEFTSFLCSKCHTEIQATPDMIGLTAECPACGFEFVIPAPESDGVIRHTSDEIDPETINAMKSKTIRIELGDI